MKNILGVFGNGGANAITDKGTKEAKKKKPNMEIKFESEI